MKLRILLKKIAMRLKKKCIKEEHERKSAHTNNVLFKGTEEKKIMHS